MTDQDRKNNVKWVVQKGYSVDNQLISEGLSFEAFDLIKKSTDIKTVEKIKGKIISKLAKNIKADCLESSKLDISLITHGVYCIAVGTGFEIDYKKQNSRIVVSTNATLNQAAFCSSIMA